MQIYGTKKVATIGPRKHITISYPAPHEDLLGAPDPLPDSQPGSPQFSYTILEGDLPDISGLSLDDVWLFPIIYAAGHNLDSGAYTLRTAVRLNGDFLTGSNDTTFETAKWTLRIVPGFDLNNVSVAVGDTIDIALWSDDVQLDYEYVALALLVLRPRVVADGSLMLDIGYHDCVTFPALTVPIVGSIDGLGATANGFDTVNIGSSKDIGAAVIDTTNPMYQLFTSEFGENALTGDDVFYTYQAFNVPTTLSCYPTSIRVV